MRHMYEFNGYPISEDLLLGLGAGVGFSYWHFKGQPPFMGGRAMPKPSMEAWAGQRTGVKIEAHTTGSARKAKASMLEVLDSGQPLMIGCDMGFLPYFDFGEQEYHFGGHVVVVAGYDAEADCALIVDRDGTYEVPMADLEKARGSTFKPFPPKNLWYSFCFSGMRPPTADEVREAIAQQVEPMLNPPIRNIGVKGIRKAAQMAPKWPASMSVDELRWALFNSYIFICPVGGTGGGTFRYMFGRFLREAAEITGDSRFGASADQFWRIGDRWETLGAWFKATSEADDPASLMGECVESLLSIADLEETAWQGLSVLAQG
jgi:hypothetical protein